MLNASISKLEILFPKKFRRDFDAHIYYTGETRTNALALRELAFQEFAEFPLFISELTDHPIGPHPTPTFELCFSRELFSEVFLWLLHRRGNLSVLVHEVTGNDHKDHSSGAVWLGERIALDQSQFD
jgi:aromatic ring-cleaving dioxygenase